MTPEEKLDKIKRILALHHKRLDDEQIIKGMRDVLISHEMFKSRKIDIFKKTVEEIEKLF